MCGDQRWSRYCRTNTLGGVGDCGGQNCNEILGFAVECEPIIIRGRLDGLISDRIKCDVRGL